LIAQDADRSKPTTAETDDLIAFAQGANGDPADRRIEPRHIPAAGENTDHAFLGAHATALFSISEKYLPKRALLLHQARLRTARCASAVLAGAPLHVCSTEACR